MSDRRWSGWPGAWCLDCGCEDPVEIAIADGRFTIDDDGDIVLPDDVVCGPCPEPGSKRHDPYARLLKEADDEARGE